jgi:hypothetical protein
VFAEFLYHIPENLLRRKNHDKENPLGSRT